MKIIKKICGIWQLIAAGVAVGIFAVVTGVMALILEKFSAQTTAASTAYNIIGYGSSALLTMAQFLGIVAITLIGAYIISLLVRQFAGGGKGAPM
jgi:heme/copper-type cytochrome/quinol oxidase subunit 2